MAVINPPGYLHNLATHTALVDRLASQGQLTPAVATELRAAGGVRIPSDCVTSASGGMNVSVSPGIVFVPNLNSAIGGTYVLANDGALSLTVSAAHATLSRYDLVVARVRDSFYSGATDAGDFFILAGTASATPVDPTPAAGSSYVILDRIVVGPAVSSIVAGNIQRVARMSQGAGAIIPVTSADVIAGLFAGHYRDHPTSGLQRWSGSAWGRPDLVDPTRQDVTWSNAAVAQFSTSPYGETMKIWKDAPDHVRLEGIANVVAGWSTAAFNAFTLPAGYRPVVQLVRSCTSPISPASSVVDINRVNITTAGIVQVVPARATTPGPAFLQFELGFRLVDP
jgi:hypothetical protein